jgi:methyl-accepting chemotaxis protein
MNEQYTRRPIKHYFIMSQTQWNYILPIMVTVALATLTTLLIVVAVYYLKFHPGDFFYLTENMKTDLVKHGIWELVLPSFLPSAGVSLLIGLIITLYSSRKMVLPIFKIRQWSDALVAGELDYMVSTRKSDNMQELATSCNRVTEKYSQILRSIDSATSSRKPVEKKVEEVKKILDSLNLPQ